MSENNFKKIVIASIAAIMITAIVIVVTADTSYKERCQSMCQKLNAEVAPTRVCTCIRDGDVVFQEYRQ